MFNALMIRLPAAPHALPCAPASGPKILSSVRLHPHPFPPPPTGLRPCRYLHSKRVMHFDIKVRPDNRMVGWTTVCSRTRQKGSARTPGANCPLRSVTVSRCRAQTLPHKTHMYCRLHPGQHPAGLQRAADPRPHRQARRCEEGVWHSPPATALALPAGPATCPLDGPPSGHPARSSVHPIDPSISPLLRPQRWLSLPTGN